MSDYHPMETRRRSRSKTPFSRPICDQENCEHTDEEDNYHHKKKMASATAGAPKVQTITEEIVEVTSSTSSSAQRDANKKIRTSDYSSDDTSPDYSKVKSRAAIELHPNEVNETVTYITTASTTTTTSGGSSTLITKSRKTMSSDNNSAATSTPKANYAVNSFAAQFATSPADILNESKGAGLREGHLEQVNATQSAINTEFEKPLQRNSMAARAKKGDNADRQRNQNNSNNSTSSGIRSIGRFFSKSFGGTRGAGDSGGGGSGGSEGDIDNVGSLSDHIAYREYKRAGEYWKTTPKTDYTYSKLSPHRRVLAPGVVAMPNMSRRSLENHHERINYMIECNPTNESFIRRRYESPKYSVNRRWDTAKLIYDSGDEVDLAQFDDIILKQSQESWFTRSITSVIAVFSTIWRTILTGIPFTNDNRYRRSKIVNEKKGLFGSLSNGFRSVVYNLFQSIYLLISYILSVDTWLLRSSNPEGKGKKRFLLFLLILLPLLLLTAWQILNESQRPTFFQAYRLLLPTTLLANVGSVLTRISAPIREFHYPAMYTTLSTNEEEAELYRTQESIKRTLTPEETRNILQHINKYMKQLLDQKLETWKKVEKSTVADGNVTPEMAMTIAKVVSMQIEVLQQKQGGTNNLHQLTDVDIERIADVVRSKLEISNIELADKYFPLTSEHLSQIHELVEERMKVNNDQKRSFFKDSDLATLIERIMRAPQLAQFIDSLSSKNVDSKLLQLKETKDKFHDDTIQRLDKYHLLVTDLYKEINLMKLALSEKLPENEKLNNFISDLRLEHERLAEDLQKHKLMTNQKVSGLLQEIEKKLTTFKTQQFALLHQQIKLSLMKNLGFNQISGEGQGETLVDDALKAWMRDVFTAKDYLEQRLLEITAYSNEKIKQEIDRSGMLLMREITERLKREVLAIMEAQSNENVVGLKKDLQTFGMSEEEVKQLVRNVLAIYDADKTGLVDFALESAGGQILSTRCTENYQTKTAQISVFGIPLWYPTNTPRVAISPNVQPGECWAFQGFPGFLVLKLNSLIYVSGFTLEHIPKSLSPNGRIESAPRNFTVWGLEHEKDQDPLLFGEYEYVDGDAALQYFPLKNTRIHRPFEIVELRIESNHGHPAYTCLYRFRVHGKPAT